LTTEDTEFTEEGKGGFGDSGVPCGTSRELFLRDREKISALKWQGRAVSRKGKGICAEAGVAQF